ncbi:protein FAM83H [Cheilinus undulatus]|uniref:protein FAM83H n=1 Tax=Cheilinus undulatus TaxID=241271 RepID=UPI001BD1D796|nr:protein FAM83H [Cheilinus undulatus]
MARRSQCSSAGDDPLNPNYLPPHYREEYRLAVDALVEDDLDGYYQFLLKADVVDFLSSTEIEYIRGAVQVPQSGEHLEQRVLEGGADGSSDTYWPLHSDLEAPGLDLGWPQTHHFIGPTEVTTLVNPPEPDMPSIKEQARRLIKNAKQVVAIVMDMFTDVDIFADILAAAMRNVAVYVLLDKENVHHFINMAANCRVDLQSIQFLRVRTVSGITYHCRSGKSFTGQMMDRFLLTDCRAVLSGNYSFMWSFEKLHRCMAHLFLGQLVSTFDEEFRILFAQSEPLIVDNMLPPIEDFSQSQKRKYPCERALLYREPKRYLSLDAPHPDEWVRHPHEDRTDLDWRMMPHKRPDVQYGPAEVYGRFSSQQPRLDPPFDQYSSRIPMMDNPAFKRHSYAEGGHGRYSLPFLQPQEVLEPETQGRQFHRGQQPYPDYSGYERFWNQDFDSADQYCEPSLPPELDRLENFDPVLNYLSSTRNADFEQAPEKIPAADLHFGSSQPRRLSLGQPYACQTSPTPSNPSDQKHLFFESNPDRKDPAVKRGLRNWRISSFLSAYDNPGDDGRPSTPPNAPDPCEDPSASVQKTATGIDLAVPKIPNVREFKIPALPRASQMPSYAKAITREPPKKAPDETTTTESRSTPTPSESSSTTEGEKTEEAEPKEPKTVQREESFRRKYNPAVQRSSRLRSSLIFSSLDQQHPTQDNKGATGQQDQESDKNEAEQKKPSYISPVFGQRRSTPREPLEWSRYLKSSTFDNSATDMPRTDNGDGKADSGDGKAEGRDGKVDGGDSKTDDKDSEKDKGLPEKTDIKEPSNAPVLEQENSTAPTVQLKSSVPKTDSAVQPKKPPFMAPVFVDMSDPDQRFLFFKELAAKRKAEKAAEAEQNKPPTDPKNNATVKEEPKEHLEKKPGMSQHLSEKHAPAEDAGKTDCTESLKAVSQPSDQSKEGDHFSKKDAKTPQSAKDEQTRNSTESEKNEPKESQSGGLLHVSAETQTPEGEKTKLLNSTEKKGCTLTPTNPVPDRPTEETPHLKSTSHHPPSLTWSKTTLSSCEKQDQSEQSCEIQDQSEQSCEIQDQPEQSCEEHHQSEPSSSSDIDLTVSGSQVSPGLETKHPQVAPADSLTSTVSSLHVEDSASQSDLSQPAEDNLHPVSSLMSPDNRADVSDSIIPSGEPSIGLEEGYHSCSDVSQLIGSEEQGTSDGTAPSTGTPSPHLPDQQRESKSDQNEPWKMSVPLAGPQNSPSTAQNLSSELCSLPETLKTPGTPTGSGVPLTKTVLTQETTTQRPSDFFSPTSPTSINPKMVSPRKTRPTTLISPTMTTDPATIGQTPTSPTMISPSTISPITISQTLTSPTPTSPTRISQTPTSPTTISQTPTSPVTISQTPTSPTTISQTPTSPTTIGQTPTSPITISQTPTSPTTISQTPTSPTPTSPTRISQTPTSPTTISQTPTSPVTISQTPTSPTTIGQTPTSPTTIGQTPTSPTRISQTPTSPSMISPTKRETSDGDLLPQTAEGVCPMAPPAGSPVPPESTNGKEDISSECETTNQREPSDITMDSNQTTDQLVGEKTNDADVASEDVVPPPVQSKHQKSTLSRYHSSTTSVLSSSNLRDDTKLLLEQISANSQNRNEAPKESAVTDDEKEDEADKNAKREKNLRGIHSLSQAPPKSSEEREKLLERIQSMRKERKVYSRFEMGP